MQITVVLPVKNGINGLAKTLASILGQKNVAFEVLVLIGKSNDGTEEYVEQFANDTRVKIFRNQDSGIYAAMNFAIQESDNSWLVFMGAGDYFISPNVLEIYSQNLIKTDDWTIGSWFFLSEDNELIGSPAHQDFDIEHVPLTTTPLCHQTVFMHKEFLQKLKGFDERYKVASDRDLILRAWMRKSPIKMNTALVCYLAGGFSSINESIGHRELKKIQKQFKLKKIKQKLFGGKSKIRQMSGLVGKGIQGDIALFNWVDQSVKNYYLK
jgi:glycosyltransferase involved in cell wall biosynthesis